MKSVSFLIPTCNSAKVLGACLRAITQQDYPRELVEIVIADAGSTDATLEIASKYTNKIYPNLLRTGEAGKAVAFRHASNEIIAMIDSDNILPSNDWLVRMLEPFADEEIIGAEPIEYTHREQDGYIVRYCAMMGMTEPIPMFLGNYDRYNLLTGKWTGLPVETEDKGNYLKVYLTRRTLPTIGANGFLIRRSVMDLVDIGNYLYDIDVLYELIPKGYNKVAKVKVGIVHLIANSIRVYARKQRRRARDRVCDYNVRARKYPWGKIMSKLGFLKYIAYTLLVFPLFAQALIGYSRKRDLAWLFHPLACWICLWEYGWGYLLGWLGRKQIFDRDQEYQG